MKQRPLNGQLKIFKETSTKVRQLKMFTSTNIPLSGSIKPYHIVFSFCTSFMVISFPLVKIIFIKYSIGDFFRFSAFLFSKKLKQRWSRHSNDEVQFKFKWFDKTKIGWHLWKTTEKNNNCIKQQWNDRVWRFWMFGTISFFGKKRLEI